MNSYGHVVLSASFFGNSLDLEEVILVDSNLKINELTEDIISVDFDFEATPKKTLVLPDEVVIKKNQTPVYNLASNEVLSDEEIILAKPKRTFEI
jgi:hypothetical protein